MDALRISPRFTSADWRALNLSDAASWVKAAEMVRDRLEGRFLKFATDCLKSEYSGFVVLAIDCLLAETLQQFREGVTDGRNQSEALITRFLAGPQFQPDFDSAASKAFYVDIRCGLLHQAEARRMWLIRRKQPKLLQMEASGQGYIIDVERFHASMVGSLDDYVEQIAKAPNSLLRASLWTKMDHISNVREARGALYEPAPKTADAP
jgi:hypothetical protein